MVKLRDGFEVAIETQSYLLFEICLIYIYLILLAKTTATFNFKKLMKYKMLLHTQIYKICCLMNIISNRAYSVWECHSIPFPI